MKDAMLHYEREGRGITFAFQGLDAGELRAIIVGLALIVQKRQRRSIGVNTELDHDGTEIAQAILRAFEKGAVEVLPASSDRGLLS